MGVEEPQFVIHEVSALAKAQRRQAWMVLGDFKKAFPSAWREKLLVLLGKGPQVQDGAFAMLADILRSDDVHI